MAETAANIDSDEFKLFLAAELGLQITQTEVVHNGLNLMIVLSTETDRNAYVLRRPNKLRHTDYMNELEAEYGVMERLHDTEIPTSAPVVFCDDESVLGDGFFITTYLDGETVPNGAPLPERFRNPESREDIATYLVDTLAAVHSLETKPFEQVCGRQTPIEQVERALDRLDETMRVTGRECPRLRAVADWLRRNPPSNSKPALVHGDFRPSNVLLDGASTPEITGVLDWEAAMVGDPLTELGYLLLHWRDDGDPTLSLHELESEYDDETIRELEQMDENGLCPFTAKPGSPTRRELVARYEGQTDSTFESERFYRAHAAFLLAMVWEDLHREAVEGGAKPDHAPSVDYMALVAESIVEGDFRL